MAPEQREAGSPVSALPFDFLVEGGVWLGSPPTPPPPVLTQVLHIVQPSLGFGAHVLLGGVDPPSMTVVSAPHVHNSCLYFLIDTLWLPDSRMVCA